MPSDETPWVVKGVPSYVRKMVKKYAVDHDMTMAQALEDLVWGGTVEISVNIPEIVVQAIARRPDKGKMAAPTLREDFESFMQNVVSTAAFNWLQKRKGIDLMHSREEMDEATTYRAELEKDE